MIVSVDERDINQLALEYHQTRDPAIANDLARRGDQRWVIPISRGFYASWKGRRDLIDIYSDGNLGLFKAIEGFDENEGDFERYAPACVRKTIIYRGAESLRDTGSIRAWQTIFREFEGDFLERTGREPTKKEYWTFFVDKKKEKRRLDGSTVDTEFNHLYFTLFCRGAVYSFEPITDEDGSETEGDQLVLAPPFFGPVRQTMVRELTRILEGDIAEVPEEAARTFLRAYLVDERSFFSVVELVGVRELLAKRFVRDYCRGSVFFRRTRAYLETPEVIEARQSLEGVREIF